MWGVVQLFLDLGALGIGQEPFFRPVTLMFSPEPPSKFLRDNQQSEQPGHKKQGNADDTY